MGPLVPRWCTVSVTPAPPDWVDWLHGLDLGMDDPLPLSLLPELPVPGAAVTPAAPTSVIAAATVMVVATARPARSPILCHQHFCLADHRYDSSNSSVAESA